jgi:hypothetical protein
MTACIVMKCKWWSTCNEMQMPSVTLLNVDHSPETFDSTVPSALRG